MDITLVAKQLQYKEITKKSDIIDKILDYISPQLNQALLQLIEKLQTVKNVQLHQEKLQNLKVRDQIEQKKHAKQRLQEELGSEYESSEESNQYQIGDDPSQKYEEDDKDIDLFDSKHSSFKQDNEKIVEESQQTDQQENERKTVSEYIFQQEDTAFYKEEQKLQAQSTKHFKQGEEMKEIIEVEEELKISPEKQIEPEPTITITEKEKFNPLRFLALSIKELNLNKQ